MASEPEADEPRARRRSIVPMLVVFGLAGAVLLVAVGYSLMMVSGPMPGMNH